MQWAADDVAPKSISLKTIDDNVREADKTLALQMVVQTSSLEGSNEIPIVITDNDGDFDAGIIFEGDDNLYTSEKGGAATLKIALERAPTANVTLNVQGAVPSEGTLSATSFVFTPQNWNVQQSLTVTGVDDTLKDGDFSYTLKFDAVSSDAAYDALPLATVSVVNVGDEPYVSPAKIGGPGGGSVARPFIEE